MQAAPQLASGSMGVSTMRPHVRRINACKKALAALESFSRVIHSLSEWADADDDDDVLDARPPFKPPGISQDWHSPQQPEPPALMETAPLHKPFHASERWR
jgi:hypothetical protein